MADGLPRYGEEPGGIISGRDVEEWAVPVVGAGCVGLAGYEISEEAPEVAAIVAGLATLWFLKTR